MKSRKMPTITIRQKLCLLFLLISAVMVTVAIVLSLQLNQAIRKVNSVYSSNISANDLVDSLDLMEKYMYEYLNTRSSESLENYYRSEQEYTDLVNRLNGKASDNAILLQEKNIRSMSETYMDKADETIQAKRGRNVEKYKTGFEECTTLYQYISEYINASNNQHFRQNVMNYTQLLHELGRMEVVSLIVVIAWGGASLLLLYFLAGSITGPLTQLAKSANQVAEGDFDVQLPATTSRDEIGSVTVAFNSMVESVKAYIEQIRCNMEHEQEMKERELLMETHLKDAQLKYLQAQINPHFLFNSLNAGAQLALMEDAEKTCLFIEKMAEFFRYNVQKTKEDTTLSEEIEAVDNYIYILNVRFAGDIHFSKEICGDMPNIRVPSMVLQPIVENAVSHGIRDIDREGRIRLQVDRRGDWLEIVISDNGKGMSQSTIHQIVEGRANRSEDTDSTGVGLGNVISRLELYYGKEDILQIDSDGEDQGTRVTLRLPIEEGRITDVPNIAG